MELDLHDDRDLFQSYGSDVELPVLDSCMPVDAPPADHHHPGLQSLTTLCTLLEWRYGHAPSILAIKHTYRTNSIRNMLKSLQKFGIVTLNDWPFCEARRNVIPDADVLSKAIHPNVTYKRVLPNEQQLKLCIHFKHPFIFMRNGLLMLGVGYDDNRRAFRVFCADLDDGDGVTFYMPYSDQPQDNETFWILD